MTKQLNYKGTDYHMRISYKAFKGVVMELGREFDGASDTFDFEGAEALLYYALKSGQEYHNLPFDLERSEMENVLDEVGLVEFIEAFAAFSRPPQKTRGRKA